MQKIINAKNNGQNNSAETYYDLYKMYSANLDDYTYPSSGSITDNTYIDSAIIKNKVNNPYTITDTTTSIGTNSIGNTAIDFNKLYNTGWGSTFSKNPFMKSDFLDSLSKGKTVVSAVSEILDSLTDDGIVDAFEFIKNNGLLTKEVYWQIVHKKHTLYIMYNQFHDVENCIAFFDSSKNHNLVKFTLNSVLNDTEFKRYINTMKLKGLF